MKPTKLLVLVLFCLPFLSKAQFNSSIDFTAGLNYGHRTLSDEISIVEEVRNDREIGRVTWHAGFNYNKKISEKFYFKTGLRIAKKGYKSKKEELRFGSQIIIELNGGEAMANDVIQSFYNFNYLEVPLMVRYEFSNKKITPYVEAGFSGGYLLGNKSILKVNGEEISSNGNEVVKDFQLTGDIAFGINYTISETLQLYTQPHFNYHLSNLVKIDNVSEHLYAVGLEFGLRKKI